MWIFLLNLIEKKGYKPNWGKDIFTINKVKDAAPWTYITENLNSEEVVGTFYEQELQKAVINWMLDEKLMIIYSIYKL